MSLTNFRKFFSPCTVARKFFETLRYNTMLSSGRSTLRARLFSLVMVWRHCTNWKMSMPTAHHLSQAFLQQHLITARYRLARLSTILLEQSSTRRSLFSCDRKMRKLLLEPIPSRHCLFQHYFHQLWVTTASPLDLTGWSEINFVSQKLLQFVPQVWTVRAPCVRPSHWWFNSACCAHLFHPSWTRWYTISWPKTFIIPAPFTSTTSSRSILIQQSFNLWCLELSIVSWNSRCSSPSTTRWQVLVLIHLHPLDV